MAAYTDREAFIPYRRAQIVELCASDDRFSAIEARQFREFCQVLAAFYHFKLHRISEIVKENFDPFNPDSETRMPYQLTAEERDRASAELAKSFGQLLERANYVPVPDASLQRALMERSLIDLRTDVDLDDFERVVCYCRGDIYKKTKVKKWVFWKKEIVVDIFERVALLLHFKDEDYFHQKGKVEDLEFSPGKVYAYLYKNVPKLDIDLLFPNVKISMTWKDRLLFAVPAVGAAVPLLIKILPQLLLIFSAILFAVGLASQFDEMTTREENIRDMMTILVATLSLCMALGGFAFKQYSSYKSKKIQFQKKVTDTLFFKNMSTNGCVFQTLLDAAEEEECKEIILVYYHLTIAPEPLTPAELDDRIEDWMEEKFGTKIDFDINGPLQNLAEIRGKLSGDTDAPEVPLMAYDDRDRCQVVSVNEAKTIIDYVWDRAFSYADHLQ